MRLLLLIGFVLFFIRGFTQNLIPNYSFEKKTECPPDFVTFYRNIYALSWESPNIGTPDYFNACANKCGVPLNWVGLAEAYHGNAYMGIIACMQQFDPKQIAYREYLRIKLRDSLESGQTYFASMKVRLALSCAVSCNGLGMFFSKDAMQSGHNINYPVMPDLTFKDAKAPINKKEWLNICGDFVAEGGEQYLIIGNFLSNQNMDYYVFDENFIPTQRISPMAYFYIDCVELYKFNNDTIYDCYDSKSEPPISFSGQLLPSVKMVLNNLYFETDKATILPKSDYELTQLSMALLEKPNLHIAIYGHTDNIGSAEHNKQLAEARAIAVKNYLIAKGVSRMRIITIGFGASHPISDNNTEQGRQLNRRVEIEIVN